VGVLATLPDHVEVGGDDVRPYVLLMNSHDGSTAVVAATTPVRVVCQNTLNWGLRSAQQKFSIRHTEAVTQRVHEARRVLDLSINYYEQFKRLGDRLASERCSERQLRSILDELYPNSTSDSVSGRTRKSRQQTKDRIAELFMRGETQGNAPGSKWAAVNAIVEYGDWLLPLRSSGQRFARTLDDGPREDPRTAARCSRVKGYCPAGVRARRGMPNRPMDATRVLPTLDGQGAGPGGRFLPRSVCNGYPN
jgi:phage/plasmid-like protein (TIGR03299 family)